MAEEARRAGTGRGRLSSWQRAVGAIRKEVIGEGGWGQTHIRGGSEICWEERICVGEKLREIVRKETRLDTTKKETKLPFPAALLQSVKVLIKYILLGSL